MFRVDVIAGTTDVSVPIHVMDSTDGTPETGYAHDTAGIDLWYRRQGGAKVAITEAALAAWNSAHTDGGVEHGSDGRGRLDLPDAACAIGTDGATYVEYGGTITGMIVIGGIVQLTDVVAKMFQSVPVGDTGNTTTTIHIPSWTYADDEVNDRLIRIYDVSEDETHDRIITDWANSTKLATVAALPDPPENDTDRVVLIGALPWNPSWDAQVQSEAADALTAASVPSDLTSIKAVTDALTSAAATKLAASMAGVITGAAATGTLSTTQATTDLSGYTADQLIGRVIVWTSGDCQGEATDITDYAVSGGLLTFTALTTTPADSDTFFIV